MEVKKGVELTNNHDQFRIEQNNIQKAVRNDAMAKEFLKHYKTLFVNLVRTDLDRDIFNDTYLKLTYNYDPEQDFKEQYTYYFNMLKGWYYRSAKVIKYHIKDFDDNIDVEDEEYIEEDKETNFEDLRNAVLSKAK